MFVLKLRLRGISGEITQTKVLCEREHFRRWMALAENPNAGKEFVFASPALMLAAVSQAASCSGRPVQSAGHLIERLEGCLGEGDPLDTLLSCIVDARLASSKLSLKLRKSETESDFRLMKFHKATGSVAVRKSLTKWMRHFDKTLVPKSKQTSKAGFRSLVDSLIGDDFQKPTLKLKGQRGSAGFAGCQLADQALVGLVRSRLELLERFDSELEQRKLQSMRLLAYGASHEINNPLANIATRAQNLLAKEDNPERRFQLSVVYEQAMRAHDMISDMMLFAHPPELRSSWVDLRIFLAELVAECRKSVSGIESSRVGLVARVASDVDSLVMDAVQVGVLLKSLIRNSVEAMSDDGGEISLRIVKGRDTVDFLISDNGRGFSEAIRSHVFDPFYSGREAGRGLGFGLSKAWRIAELHGGSLRLLSEPEKGFVTTFAVSIPCRIE